ncbi:MAG: ABC transporter substrate-binding protein [Pyramidobacter sp.]
MKKFSCSLFAALCVLFSMNASLFAAPKHVVGIIQLVEHPSLDEIRTAIVDELNRSGYGPDVLEVDYQNGQNSPQMISTICQKFVSRGVDVIVPIATPAAQGAAAASETIPVVFSAVSDPVAAGLVKDAAHPEHNVTGVSDAMQPSKVFDLAEELTPGLKTFGVIYNTAEANSVNTVRKAEAELEKRGMAYREAVVSSSAEVVPAVNSLMDKVDALFIPDDNTVAVAMPLLSETAKERNVPVYAAVDSLVHDGGLATCGINYTQLGRQTAQMVIRVLNGSKIADTPVEVMKGANVVVNAETAKALGIDVSKYLQEEAR